MNERPRVARKGGKVDGQMSRGKYRGSRRTRGSTKTRSSARPCTAAKKVTRSRTSVSRLLEEASAAKSCTAHGNLPDTRRFVNVNVGGPERSCTSDFPFTVREMELARALRVRRVGP
ncbi:unnamed protein product [Lasius platythorax]|uniref:Uncharacterized protein n=1 Tax=Lasius platythorax TaxID=488582 RepID=A0AAV2NCL2_9HYME